MAEERMLNDEILLGLIKANSGGGGGGTTDYDDLNNKPQIGGVTLSGNKSASDLGLATTTDLAGKQDVLTAGDYVTISNDTISVSKSKNAGYSVYEYRFITVDTGSAPKVKIQKYIDDVLISDTTYNEFQVQPKITVDDLFEFWYSAAHWYYKTLVASNEHPIDTTVNWAWNQTVSYTETWNITGESVTDLMTRGDVQDVTGNLSNLATTTKTDLVSAVNELNTGLSGKQDTLTFDSVPTDGSTNPVESNGVYDALALKQDKTDNTLQTTSKTVVGGINELKSGLTTLDNEVNGDATVYPYADVITIPDAIPANLADCKVKIEPVQDLHGYDNPWVGGAGHNMADPSKLYLFTNNTYVGTTNFGTEGAYDVEPNTEYRFFAATAGADKKVYFWDSEGNQITQTANTNVFTTPANCAKISFYRSLEAVQTVDEAKVMLCLSQYTTFEPYENICPISGHTKVSVQRDGKNLFNKNNSGEIFTGYMSPSNSNLRSDANSRCCFIPCEPNTTYTVSKTAGARFSAGYTKETPGDLVSVYGLVSDNTASSITITTGDGAKYLVGYVFNSQYDSGNADAMIASVQIEKGSPATPYVPYAGKTYTIALGDTIYGGTVDFDSGVMTVTHKNISFDGTENWFQSESPRDKCFSLDGDLGIDLIWGDTLSNGIANYLTANNVNAYNGRGYCFGYATKLYVSYESAEDLADFKSILSNNNLQIVAKLATPFTVQLPPQQIQLLKGQNTLTASTGQISVTVNGVSGSIGSVQEQANDTDEALAELAADIAEQLPTAPTTDGAYVLTVTVADGTPTYSWESAT